MSKTVAELVVKARLDAGFTQAQLAAAAGTSQPAVNDYERGRKIPSIPTLERLLSACGRGLTLGVVPLERGAPRRPTSVRSQLGPRARELRRHRRQLIEVARAHGAHNLRVFGSVARGEDRLDSDIDLLVDLMPGRTLLDLAGLREDASDILAAPVDVATEAILKPRARENALREAIPL